MQTRSISTVIVGPHKLLRAGISYLIEEFLFNVVATFGSMEDAGQNRFANHDPELVLICIQSAERALKDSAEIRQQWPTCKIVLLFDQLPPRQLQKLGQASIDGCIPLRVSRELLIRTLKLIVLGGARILMHDEPSKSISAQREAQGERQAEQLHSMKPSSGLSSATGITEEVADNGAEQREEFAVGFDPVGSNDQTTVQSPQFPTLSGREEMILDGLVRGFSNKQIARECGITEATVKVHMKSILRKIQVSNRTQAAIWALDRKAALTSSVR
ncbi:DNA-binding response regulator [Rhodopseudomonas telluris]|uniref:DNA-binding response regulator n=1 Tax=Rhodopseudomonas telluris TaxID=644215 RepID=A0ABV6EWS3_9BRAD